MKSYKETAPPRDAAAAALKELSGIWAGRDVSLEDIRDKAWRLKTLMIDLTRKTVTEGRLMDNRYLR
jgi:hypothetical protein